MISTLWKQIIFEIMFENYIDLRFGCIVCRTLLHYCKMQSTNGPHIQSSPYAVHTNDWILFVFHACFKMELVYYMNIRQSKILKGWCLCVSYNIWIKHFQLDDRNEFILQCPKLMQPLTLSMLSHLINTSAMKINMKLKV